MEILGIGTDIVECLRIGRMIERHGEAFLWRVYTEEEIDRCRDSRQSTEQFAAHWAAKEAAFRALGTGWQSGLSWTDIRVRRDGGRPAIELAGAARDLAVRQGVGRVLVSLAHCRAYATAHCVALRTS